MLTNNLKEDFTPGSENNHQVLSFSSYSFLGPFIFRWKIAHFYLFLCICFISRRHLWVARAILCNTCKPHSKNKNNNIMPFPNHTCPFLPISVYTVTLAIVNGRVRCYTSRNILITCVLILSGYNCTKNKKRLLAKVYNFNSLLWFVGRKCREFILMKPSWADLE